jgi:methylmalonyl-CoA/ethylmalonyl-CoA epimerase
MATGTPFIVDGLAQVAVTAHDVDRAEAFYRDVLGLRHLFTVPKMAFFDCGGVRLMLALPEKAEFDHPASILYFKVASVRAACDVLRGRGVVFEGEPHVVAPLGERDLWMAFFRDSEGNLMAVTSEEPR